MSQMGKLPVHLTHIPMEINQSPASQSTKFFAPLFLYRCESHGSLPADPAAEAEAGGRRPESGCISSQFRQDIKC